MYIGLLVWISGRADEDHRHYRNKREDYRYLYD